MIASLSNCGRTLDGGTDALMGTAAAEVASQRVLDLNVAWFGRAAQQGG